MTKLSDSRRMALKTLSVARERDAYVRELMGSMAGERGKSELSQRDAAFAERLVLGVTAARGTLDEAIDRFVKKPSALDPGVRDALRIAAYEILFLDKSPHAAVSQGVEMVKTQAKSAAGLANAVLHRVAESAGEFMAESPAHRYGLPAWLCDRLVAELGEDAFGSYAAALLEPAPLYVANVPQWIGDRRAAETLESVGTRVRPAGSIPGSWQVQDARAMLTSDLVGGPEEQVVVADYGAQCVAYLASPDPGDRLLEVGSGRGTKTILMAGHVHRRQGAARMWALDVHRGRSQLAAERLEGARVSGVTQVTGDARDLGSVEGLPPLFDRILVDAPCSGSGTLRRHPEIVWSLSPDDVTSCAQTQTQLLASCMERLAVGGVITYATCSVMREEDEDVVASVMSSPAGADFEVVPVSSMARDAECADEFEGLETPEGYLRTPVRPGGCDGHFCACLRRVR